MYTVGQLLQGETWTDEGKEVVLTGTFLFRTDDPEEHIQDIVLLMPDGTKRYFDEQGVRPVIYLSTPQRELRGSH